MEQNYKTRQRVNFSVSTKGVITPDVTFEGVDMSKEEVLSGAKELLDEAMKYAKEKSVG